MVRQAQQRNGATAGYVAARWQAWLEVMRPADERIGRRLINGRFEVTEWVGTSEFMGVAIALDHQTGGQVRVTTSSDVAPSLDELRPRLTRDVPGLAPVVFFGAAESDDGWAR